MPPTAGRHGPAPGRLDPGRGAPEVDLHTHTSRSDGLLAPDELVRQAATAGIRTLAITDHDTLAGIHDLCGTGGSAGAASLDLVVGVEINAVGPGVDGGEGEGELHILGYGMDPDDDRFEATLSAQRSGRRRRFEAIVARLRELGLPVDRELEGLVPDDEDALGRPTAARALVAAGHASSVEDAFSRVLARGRPGYLPRQGLGPVEAIAAIRAAGGIAVLAHFAEAPRRLDVLAELREAGLAGLEVHYRSFDDATIADLARTAADLGLLATGGTDYHGDDGSYADRLADLRIPATVGADLARRVAADHR